MKLIRHNIFFYSKFDKRLPNECQPDHQSCLCLILLKRQTGTKFDFPLEIPRVPSSCEGNMWQEIVVESGGNLKSGWNSKVRGQTKSSVETFFSQQSRRWTSYPEVRKVHLFLLLLDLIARQYAQDNSLGKLARSDVTKGTDASSWLVILLFTHSEQRVEG